MTDKRTPTYDLSAIKESIKSFNARNITGVALRGAAELGMTRDDILSIIQTIQPSQFYKSMTSYADQAVWQDVYHVP
jgi:motility quorum-sensing regulator / GCU-specific mRNA interferase toxin